MARPAWSANSSSRCSRTIRGSRSNGSVRASAPTGKAFRDAAAWRLPNRLPDDVAPRIVQAAAPGNAPKLVFSGLDSSVAGEIEGAFAASRPHHREQLAQLPDGARRPAAHSGSERASIWRCSTRRRKAAAGKGASSRIRTARPSCLPPRLAPLRQFGLKTTMITTLQAISGAGYPGVPVVGHSRQRDSAHRRRGRKDRNRNEARFSDRSRTARSRFIPVRLSATTTRVPVQNGHTESISVGLEQQPTPEAIIDAWSSFRGKPQELDLPSAPKQPIVYLDRSEPAAAASRREPRRRHGRQRRPAAPLPALRLQVHRARPQHDSRRRRRGHSERRADASRGPAVNANVIMKFGGTSVADAEAMNRVLGIVPGTARAPARRTSRRSSSCPRCRR